MNDLKALYEKLGLADRGVSFEQFSSALQTNENNYQDAIFNAAVSAELFTEDQRDAFNGLLKKKKKLRYQLENKISLPLFRLQKNLHRKWFRIFPIHQKLAHQLSLL